MENAEKRYDSQLARRIIIALPKELSHEDNIALVRQYCREQFVSKGMCCDFAVHDEGDGNPHAHVLLTMRGLDEQGKWLPKSKPEFELDENGQRIRQKNGRWKCRKVNTVDWNDQKYCEVWRHEWELLQNRYLESAGREERVDLRSFERQGSDFAPTVHMGAAITHITQFIHRGDGVIQLIMLYDRTLLDDPEAGVVGSLGNRHFWHGRGSAHIEPFGCFGELTVQLVSLNGGPCRMSMTDADGIETVLVEGENAVLETIPAPRIENGALDVTLDGDGVWFVEIDWFPRDAE